MSPNRSIKRPVIEPVPIARIGRAERTRAEILDAAFEFLWSRPFRELTVNALMAMIPQGRTAFYKYFDDIHGVMAALLKNLESEILKGASPWLSDDGGRERAYNCGPGARPDRSFRSPASRNCAEPGRRRYVCSVIR
jgi:hypothetical protein